MQQQPQLHARKQQGRSIAGPSSSQKGKIGRISVIQTFVLCAVCGVVSFYLGVVLGSSATCNCNENNSKSSPSSIGIEVSKECYSPLQVQEKLEKSLREQRAGRDTDPRFPKDMSKLVVGMTQVDRDDFAKTFNMGLPLDHTDQVNRKVLMLYANEKALPNNPFAKAESKSQTKLPLVSAEDATANCDFVHIVLQDHSGGRRQCTAIFGQYEAFHIQKFMRLPVEKGKLDPKLPLRLVNRAAQASGRKSVPVPRLESTQRNWDSLQTYLGNLHGILDRIKPIAQKAAVNNTIVVQVCNFGQSELLINSICAAKNRGLDISSILVFATDQETFDLVQHMGVHVIYDPLIFGEMPGTAARSYGDRVFQKMMMAKIYCVHLISMLGFDVLFQDVDVIWYRNPLEYFHDEAAMGVDKDFDVYFQDDGNHALFYAPYSANTGFYFVRNNEKTVYFFNSFLAAGDLVIETRSHQIPLVALLQEHASMYGLKIKIFERDGDIFPGGHAYHRRKEFMRDIIQGKAHPYVFHMSWTHSSVNKVKFFSQMGEWFLDQKCQNKKLPDIFPQGAPEDIASHCCTVEPLITCHYRDKPSKIPCKDSPPIDKGGASFWR